MFEWILLKFIIIIYFSYTLSPLRRILYLTKHQAELTNKKQNKTKNLAQKDQFHIKGKADFEDFDIRKPALNCCTFLAESSVSIRK